MSRLPPRTEPEVLIERLVAPSLVHVREPFDVEMHLVARQATRGTLLVARNQEMAGPEARIADGDEIGIFPPVTGG